MSLQNPIHRTGRGRQVLELGGQELANLIAVNALLPVPEDLLLNIPIDPADFSTSARDAGAPERGRRHSGGTGDNT